MHRRNVRIRSGGLCFRTDNPSKSPFEKGDFTGVARFRCFRPRPCSRSTAILQRETLQVPLVFVASVRHSRNRPPQSLDRNIEKGGFTGAASFRWFPFGIVASGLHDDRGPFRSSRWARPSVAISAHSGPSCRSTPRLPEYKDSLFFLFCKAKNAPMPNPAPPRKKSGPPRREGRT